MMQSDALFWIVSVVTLSTTVMPRRWLHLVSAFGLMFMAYRNYSFRATPDWPLTCFNFLGAVTNGIMYWYVCRKELTAKGIQSC